MEAPQTVTEIIDLNDNPVINTVPTGYSSDLPQDEPGLWRIEMKDEGQWAKLGGVFTAKLADERIDNFMLHYMYKPSGSQARECKRQFRRVRVGQCLPDIHVI